MYDPNPLFHFLRRNIDLAIIVVWPGLVMIVTTGQVTMITRRDHPVWFTRPSCPWILVGSLGLPDGMGKYGFLKSGFGVAFISGHSSGYHPGTDL